jgi:hypothetical protein
MMSPSDGCIQEGAGIAQFPTGAPSERKYQPLPLLCLDCSLEAFLGMGDCVDKWTEWQPWQNDAMRIFKI